MIVSDKYKFIFLEVPKTATVTVRARIGFLNEHEEFDKPHFNEQLNKIITRHISLQELSKLDIFENIKNYFKFCFVRNPYEYFYSSAQFQTSPDHVKELEKLRQTDSVWAEMQSAEKLNKLKQCTDRHGHFLFSQYLDLFPLPQTQRSFFTDWTHLNKASHMSYIGKNENFENDFKTICNKIGISYESISKESKNILSQPINNKNKKSFFDDGSVYKYLHNYNEEALEGVNKQYKQDFEFFGYRQISVDELIEYRKWYSNEEN